MALYLDEIRARRLKRRIRTAIELRVDPASFELRSALLRDVDRIFRPILEPTIEELERELAHTRGRLTKSLARRGKEVGFARGIAPEPRKEEVAS